MTHLIGVLLLISSGSAVPPEHVDHHTGEVEPVAQADGHRDDGEDGHDEGHEAHHEAARPDVDTAAASLEARHDEAGWT